MSIITSDDITRQVNETLTEVDGIDMAGIVREIIDTYGRVDLDAIDTDAYWEIVRRHDASQA